LRIIPFIPVRSDFPGDRIRIIVRRGKPNNLNDVFAGRRCDRNNPCEMKGFASVAKGDLAKTGLIKGIASVAKGDLAKRPSHFLPTACHRAAFIGLILLLAAGSECRQSKDPVLAVVGKRTVTAGVFAERLIEARTRMNLPDNGKVRKEVLRMMVED
jgi:hypothetical protein